MGLSKTTGADRTEATCHSFRSREQSAQLSSFKTNYRFKSFNLRTEQNVNVLIQRRIKRCFVWLSYRYKMCMLSRRHVAEQCVSIVSMWFPHQWKPTLELLLHSSFPSQSFLMCTVVHFTQLCLEFFFKKCKVLFVKNKALSYLLCIIWLFSIFTHI